MATSNKTSNINNSPGSQQATGDGITQIQADNLTIIYGNDAASVERYLRVTLESDDKPWYDYRDHQAPRRFRLR